MHKTVLPRSGEEPQLHTRLMIASPMNRLCAVCRGKANSNKGAQ